MIAKSFSALQQDLRSKFAATAATPGTGNRSIILDQRVASAGRVNLVLPTNAGKVKS